MSATAVWHYGQHVLLPHLHRPRTGEESVHPYHKSVGQLSLPSISPSISCLAGQSAAISRKKSSHGLNVGIYCQPGKHRLNSAASWHASLPPVNATESDAAPASIGSAVQSTEPEILKKKPAVNSGYLKLNSGSCCLPHPAKVKTGGEDAHFISVDFTSVGVADGVGGWADLGVDAGIYARELMARSEKAMADQAEGRVTPSLALRTAHGLTKCKGSSTACIVALTGDRIHAANLGDSGFVVIRNGRLLFKSPPQQHGFNYPYQIGVKDCDSPELAEEYILPVVEGDILVVGTDGLFDNLFDNELTSVVMHSVKAGWTPHETAERIATLAHLRAQDHFRMSPFAKAAQEAGFRFSGGKMDDITVVVSYIATVVDKEQNE